jgi:hypothetical protein
MSDQPNIVLIVADDMGYGDFGCFNNGLSDTLTVCHSRHAGLGFRYAQPSEVLLAGEPQGPNDYSQQGTAHSR